MFVKICGLKTPTDVDAAVRAGADAIGFVFVPGGPRSIDPESVAELVSRVPENVEMVGVFRNQDIDEVIRIARAAGVQTVQLHGDETLADLAAVKAAGFTVLRAFSADAYSKLEESERAAWDAERILLDAVEPGAGVTFDPAVLDGDFPPGDWLLAGGLRPANVAELVALFKPAGVDVSSGVEASRGVKDPELIRGFVAAAKAAHSN
ncbi:phosphoribosylanthranilate isomerase [Micrococcoides hystricis]|uniref:N-(5'-phosphoribosyl)anthranilate isomerase n=1 Tax=Micrococcoides hystricis TaxID=1572761 RepID=A0ABV6PED4_9MICC